MSGAIREGFLEEAMTMKKLEGGAGVSHGGQRGHTGGKGTALS